MSILSKELIAGVCEILANNPKFQNVKIYISGADVAGESEFKIIHRISQLPPEETCLIVSTDSDLISMSFRAKNHVKVVRQEDSLLMSVDINKLRTEIVRGIDGDPDKIIDDYCFLLATTGNDYTIRLIHSGSILYQYKLAKEKRPGKYLIQTNYASRTTTIDMNFLWEIFSMNTRTFSHYNLR